MKLKSKKEIERILTSKKFRDGAREVEAKGKKLLDGTIRINKYLTLNKCVVMEM